jgi:hypothetical protein
LILAVPASRGKRLKTKPEPRFAILNPRDSKRLGSVTDITYVDRNMAMFPRSMGGHDAQKFTYWTKHSDCQLHAVVRPQLSGQASF